MTRDEAIRVLQNCRSTGDTAVDYIEPLIRLGLLKLEEPKRAPFQEFCMRLAGDFGWSHCSREMNEIALALDAANLKIVDKGE